MNNINWKVAENKEKEEGLSYVVKSYKCDVTFIRNVRESKWEVIDFKRNFNFLETDNIEELKKYALGYLTSYPGMEEVAKKYKRILDDPVLYSIFCNHRRGNKTDAIIKIIDYYEG